MLVLLDDTAAAGRLESYCLFDAVMASMRLGTDAQEATARQFGKEVRQEFTALVGSV